MAVLTYQEAYAAYSTTQARYADAEAEIEGLKTSAKQAIRACQDRDSMQAISILSRGLLDCPGGYAAQETPVQLYNILRNGTFSDGAYWTMDEGTITISGGEAVFSGPAAGARLRQALTLSAGVPYQITFRVTNYTAGSIRWSTPDGQTGIMRAAVGTYIQIIRPTILCSEIRFERGGDEYIAASFIGRIDDVAVYTTVRPS